MITIRSRINEFIPDAAMKEMYQLCMNPTISNNNDKADGMLMLLRKHNVECTELGPGTNRFAVLIDNYVFKIGLDKQGLQDNANEYVLSEELQPLVTKTYELSANWLITVNEYVTVIDREEFVENEPIMRRILGELADSYLLGDVGIHPKNFTNWGYRDDGDLVILDFAYIFNVQSTELMCHDDMTMLDYDANFHNLFCPRCRRKYTFSDIRRRISIEQENRDHELAIQNSYKLSKAVQSFNRPISKYDDPIDEPEESTPPVVPSYTNTLPHHTNEEELNMARRYEDEYEENTVDSYEEAMERMNRIFDGDTLGVVPLDDVTETLPLIDPINDAEEVQLVEVQRRTENEVVGVRVMTRGKDENASKALHHAHDVIDEALESAQDAVESAEDAVDRIEHEDDANISTEGSFNDRFSDILDQENPESEFSINIGGKPQSMLNEDMHQPPTVDVAVKADADFHIPTEEELEEQANNAYLNLLQHPPHASGNETVEDSIEERIVEDLSADVDVPDTLPDPETISDEYVEGTEESSEQAEEDKSNDVAVVEDTPEVLDVVKTPHETIVHNDTVHVTPDMLKDGVTIQNTVTISTESSDIDEMRRALSEGLTSQDSATRAEELAEDFAHLEDDNEDPHMRRRGKEQ